ncbi:DUF2934 domain-containing protein [Burkholderia cenocepacia]|uniref:DUF2934 domain-containing protein n=1 Tax=Burkholderia cenocepacia TaxID=95486 RepID=UPI0004F5DC7F|nr:DUF2934 domain-containing protein [Burkholderia cenocepacia]AIO43726.1 hypothetical protein DM42_6992 [Burkholderia cepacia]KGC04891.1 hypothetical protein DM44_6515 [Burkholderia cepacia]MCG0579561.1 DUF2934 domain-containing protein [Burkholderia cenocepacia]MCW3525490.1 DUF2934 domain-containing protein [Burkholderia cenocepacia]MCW3615678.1 DUF2934 domain-containing protein [Burkholderia cenocepacia]
MDEDRETQIRERAYQLWQADGAPDGRADEYWQRAEQQLDAEGSSADGQPADLPADQSAKRRIPGEPLQDVDAVPTGEVAHEKRRTQ